MLTDAVVSEHVRRHWDCRGGSMFLASPSFNEHYHRHNCIAVEAEEPNVKMAIIVIEPFL
eukprot:5055757-Amphidinium_carterae.1